MTATELRMSQLIRWNTKNNASVRAFTFHTSTIADRIGAVFGVLRLDGNAKVSDVLLAHIEDAFLRSTLSAIDRLPDTAGATQIFEQSIFGVNQMLSRLLVEHGLTIDAQNVQSVIVSQTEGALVMASWGSPQALLVRNTKTVTKIFDLLKERNEPINPKLPPLIRSGYSTLINGQLRPDDKLCIATDDIKKILGHEKISEIIFHHDPEAATTLLQGELTARTENYPVALMVTELARPENMSGADRNIQAISPPPEKMSEHIVTNYARTIIARLRDPSFYANTKEKIQKIADRAVGIWNELPRPGRYALLTALAGIFLLNMSADAISLYRIITDRQNTYFTDIKLIEQNLATAEAGTLFGDTARTKTRVTALEKSIAALAARDQLQILTKRMLTKKVMALNATMRQATMLVAPQIVSTISVAGDRPSLQALHITQQTLWTLSTSGQLFRVSLKDGAATIAATLPTPTLFAPDDARLFVAGARGTTQEFSSSAPTKTYASPVPTNIIVTASAWYGGKLYIADSAENRILKIPLTSTSFGKPMLYLKDGTDISGVMGMAIDSAIYLLNKDGSVYRLDSGKRTSFSLSAITPPLVSGRSIWTDVTSPFLYIFDPKNSRVAQFKKSDGTLATQFVHESLGTASAITVDETQQTLYATRDNTLYKFSLLSSQTNR